MSLIFGVQVEDGDVGAVSFVLGRIVGKQLGPVWPGVVQDIMFTSYYQVGGPPAHPPLHDQSRFSGPPK